MGRTSRGVARFLACLLTCVVALCAAPGAAMAETRQTEYIDANSDERTVEATVVEAGVEKWFGSYTRGWYVADGEVHISSHVTVSGNVSLILADGAELTVTGGIDVSSGNSLTVYAQSAGDRMGKLVADARGSNSMNVAGIGGGGQSYDSGAIAIHGGAVTAYGDSDAAGIGGGFDGDGLNITVSGGVVNAHGGSSGAGIGGGYQGAGSNITISGGTVTAYGGQLNDVVRGGAGIGGGEDGDGSRITVSGGIVTAEGGANGAGIGGGDGGSGLGIEISGGVVTASGGDSGAGIGGGNDGNGSDIAVKGGTVTVTGGESGAAIGGGYVGSGTGIEISGGFIKAVADSPTFAIGNGNSAEGQASVTITGGCFAQDAGGDVGTIYGIAPAAGCAVMANDDEDTREDYPWRVAQYSTGDFAVTGGVADTDYTYVESGRVLTIITETPLTVSMREGVTQTTTDRIAVEPDGGGTAHLTIDDVAIDVSKSGYVAAMLIRSGSLELTLSGDNRLTSGEQYAGLQNGVNPLTIKGDGSLEATGGSGSAGIGGGEGRSGSGFTVEGGSVTATGGDWGAGIGGGYDGVGANIEISGGLVRAEGRKGGSAIGNGTMAGATAEADVAITGGAFADTAIADGETRDTVYGVELGDGHVAAKNQNEDEGGYPVRVYARGETSFTDLDAQGPITETYNGSGHPVDLNVSRDGQPVDGVVVEYRVHGADETAEWSAEAPTNAGGYDVRLTVPHEIDGGTCYPAISREYTGDADGAPLVIKPADVVYTLPSDLLLSAEAGAMVGELADADRLADLLGSPTYSIDANGSLVTVPGSWSWVDSDEILAVGDTTARATFTQGADLAGNFDFGDGATALTVDVPVTVTAAEPDPGPGPVTPPSRPTYPPEVPETDGGEVEVSPSRPHAGDEVTVTPKPDEGKEVRDVTVTDSDGNEVEVADNGDGTWTFEQPAGKVTIVVTFGCDGGELCPGRAFADVDPGAWYHDAVDWAVATGAMTGYADGTFGPADALSRAQLATVLWRLAGEPAGSAALPADCGAGEFYSDAVSWALGTGVMTGYESGSFGPADELTREQAATVLWRAAGSPEAECDLSAYPDAGGVSEFASAAVRWAVSEGVISGREPEPGARVLDPQGTCSRAEVAALLMRLSGAE